MEEALFLTRFASKVTLIHRREQFRASKIMLDRAIGHEKIQFLTNTIVEEVLGVEKKEVTGLRLRNLVTQEESILPVSAMFLGIGHIPNAKMFTGQIDLDDDGYIRTHDYVFTRVAGVFRVWRRAGPPVSPGDYRRWKWLHGGARGGKVSGRTRALSCSSCRLPTISRE